MNNKYNNGIRDTKLYDEARKRVKLKKDFKAHRNSFILCMGFLLIINIWTSPGYLWVKWPALGWGLGLAFHWLDVMSKLKKINNAKSEIEREMDILRNKMGYEKIEDDSKTQFYKEKFNQNFNQNPNQNPNQNNYQNTYSQKERKNIDKYNENH